MTDLFSYVVLGTSRGLIYGILALGLVLIYKGTRVLNLAQPFFGLFGAFLCWWLTAEAGFLPFEASTRPRFLVALVLTLAIVGLQAAGLERALFRKLRKAPGSSPWWPRSPSARACSASWSCCSSATRTKPSSCASSRRSPAASSSSAT